MIQLSTISELRAYLGTARKAGKRIGLVPTMGYLHEGHISLVTTARQTCDVVVMSIFVNPLQFGPNEDLSRYPRDMERDRKIASEVGVDVLFTPTVEEMYPHKVLTTVSVAQISAPLCGASRPGHFDGVATVVTKLFQIVQPDAAFFGQKDAQQLAVIEQLVSDLSIPVQIVPCPTVREADGLAKSSRNVYLTGEERKQAVVLYESLQSAKRLIEVGERSGAVIKQELVGMISQQPLAEIDYAEVMVYPELIPVMELQPGERILIALAVRFNRTRLIDNLIMTIDS